MADMADIDDAECAWDEIHETLEASGWSGRVIPVTYVNSSAAIKAFVGARGGACCTSSNAKQVFAWALEGGTKPVHKGERIKVLFLPDQHLGRNTAAEFGIDVARSTCVYNPRRAEAGEPLGGMSAEKLARAKVILWAGHCSVHQLFRKEHCDEARKRDPKVQIIVHPECSRDVVEHADLTGSTEFIIKTLRDAPRGSTWTVGTEIHLVNRLAREAAARGVKVNMLSGCQCLCTTMYRIDEPHLLWVLDHLTQGTTVNQIRVPDEMRGPALVSLERMLALAQPMARLS